MKLCIFQMCTAITLIHYLPEQFLRLLKTRHSFHCRYGLLWLKMRTGENYSPAYLGMLPEALLLMSHLHPTAAEPEAYGGQIIAGTPFSAEHNGTN